jgi:UPF0755 protein
MRRALWIGVGLAGFAAGLLVTLPVVSLFSPADPTGRPRVFLVESGEPVPAVIRRLDEEHLLPDRPLFGPRVLVLVARLSGADRAIKSGEYELSPALTPIEILERLRSGTIRTLPVTIPEGLRIDEVAARLEQGEITSAAALVARAMNPEFTRSLGIEAETLEGYLYPETYRFRRETPADEVLRAFVDEFNRRLTEETRAQIAASGMTLHEVVTLASIVEKETAVAEERPLIAAVFRNRLEKRMRLQSDPTVIYGIVRTRGHFDGNLRRRDLKRDTPYNTYTRGGFPPGPIANPTIASIDAVLAPADTPYLYFVSRNDGTHVFSNTLKEHTNAVNRYQRGGRRSTPANSS